MPFPDNTIEIIENGRATQAFTPCCETANGAGTIVRVLGASKRPELYIWTQREWDLALALPGARMVIKYPPPWDELDSCRKLRESWLSENSLKGLSLVFFQWLSDIEPKQRAYFDMLNAMGKIDRRLFPDAWQAWIRACCYEMNINKEDMIKEGQKIMDLIPDRKDNE